MRLMHVGLTCSMLLAGALPALACEEYPGQPVPTITGTNLEPCEPLKPFVPQVVVVRPVFNTERAADVTGSVAGSVLSAAPLRQPRCQAEQYTFDAAVVRVHRC
jgi:hypothetical protein